MLILSLSLSLSLCSSIPLWLRSFVEQSSYSSHMLGMLLCSARFISDIPDKRYFLKKLGVKLWSQVVKRTFMEMTKKSSSFWKSNLLIHDIYQLYHNEELFFVISMKVLLTTWDHNFTPSFFRKYLIVSGYFPLEGDINHRTYILVLYGKTF